MEEAPKDQDLEQNQNPPQPPHDETVEKDKVVTEIKEKDKKDSTQKKKEHHHHHHHHHDKIKKPKKGKESKDPPKKESKEVDKEAKPDSSTPTTPIENPVEIEETPKDEASKESKVTDSEAIKSENENSSTLSAINGQNTHSTAISPKKVRDGCSVDRYGYEVAIASKELTKREKELIAAEKIKETERETKWLYMFAHWKEYSTKKRNKLEERIRKGIPDTVRSRAWQLIIDPESISPDSINRQKPYDIFPHYSPEDQQQYKDHPCWSTIEVDLQRTMPTSTMFTVEEVLSSLRNVLRAYSIFDQETGYTQGMGFSAAMLLSYMDECSAYYCFRNLMHSPRYDFRFFFMDGFGRLVELNKVWEIILNDKYPKIYKRFNSEYVSPMMYTPQWFMSAFMTQTFPSDLRIRIFDRYVTFGTRSLVSFALVLISRMKKELMSSPIEDVIPMLQKPGSYPIFSDWRYVIKKWDEKWITEKQMQSYFKKAKVAWFP